MPWSRVGRIILKLLNEYSLESYKMFVAQIALKLQQEYGENITIQ